MKIAFFEIIQTGDTIIKRLVKILLVTTIISKLKAQLITLKSKLAPEPRQKK